MPIHFRAPDHRNAAWCVRSLSFRPSGADYYLDVGWLGILRVNWRSKNEPKVTKNSEKNEMTRSHFHLQLRLNLSIMKARQVFD